MEVGFVEPRLRITSALYARYAQISADMARDATRDAAEALCMTS